MKKFFILVVVAAVVGILISRFGGPVAEQPGTSEQPARAAAPADRTDASPAHPTLSATRPAPPALTPAPPQSASPAASAALTAAPASPTRTPSAPAAPVVVQQASLVELNPKMLEPAAVLLKDGKRLEARMVLSDLYWRGDSKMPTAAHAMLEEINRELVFNPASTEGSVAHTVKGGEVLSTISQQYGVSWRMIARLNGMSRPNLIRVNQRLKILVGEQKMLVHQKDFTLALFIGGHFIKQYKVGLGKDGKTPNGNFAIAQMMIKPDWYPPEGGVIRYGEEGHVIGERWIGFANQPGAVGIGIHGTNEPETIGTFCSNGCIRMHNDDVVELYDFIVPGAKITVME